MAEQETGESSLARFDVMAAMCHGNRGIGLNQRLPWPLLPNWSRAYVLRSSGGHLEHSPFNVHVNHQPPHRNDVMLRSQACWTDKGSSLAGRSDVAYYKAKTRSFQNTDSEKDGKFIVHICGRLSWESNKDRDCPNVRYVIISSNMTSDHPSIIKIVPSFEAAFCFTSDLCNHGNVDSIWVMGGSRVYEAALTHTRCRRLYLVHVYQDFPADTFFPKFEENYTEVKAGLPTVTKYDENGVKFEFKAYERVQNQH